jgi:hypothetical protein
MRPPFVVRDEELALLGEHLAAHVARAAQHERRHLDRTIEQPRLRRGAPGRAGFGFIIAR